MHWINEAACRDAGTDQFFTYDIVEQKQVIATFCAPCPVREECLEEFFTQKDGIFGGMTVTARDRYRRRLSRRAA